jgi:hypothetical protein
MGMDPHGVRSRRGVSAQLDWYTVRPWNHC